MKSRWCKTKEELEDAFRKLKAAARTQTTMSIGKCLKCDMITAMTEDHIIPKWLRKCLPLFGIKATLSNSTQLVCQKCNSKKGGSLDYTDTQTREVMKQLVETIIIEIRKNETYQP